MISNSGSQWSKRNIANQNCQEQKSQKEYRAHHFVSVNITVQTMKGKTMLIRKIHVWMSTEN